jgi:hypothetical protein
VAVPGDDRDLVLPVEPICGLAFGERLVDQLADRLRVAGGGTVVGRMARGLDHFDHTFRIT